MVRLRRRQGGGGLLSQTDGVALVGGGVARSDRRRVHGGIFDDVFYYVGFVVQIMMIAHAFAIRISQWNNNFRYHGSDRWRFLIL